MCQSPIRPPGHLQILGRQQKHCGIEPEKRRPLDSTATRKELFKKQADLDSNLLEPRNHLDDMARLLAASGTSELAQAFRAEQNAEDDLAKPTIYAPLTGTITKLIRGR